ncbi:MAG: carboxyl transferase domain-containing protein, partial [Candidatus Binatia bacterium]
PSRSASGDIGPSNNARLRMYLRRIRAGGSGLPEEFLARLRKAMAHYGIGGLDFSNALERAVVRLLASQRSRALRDRLLLAILNRLKALVRQGAPLARDESLREVLERVVAMRGLLPDSVADAAIQTRYEIFQRPEIEARAIETSRVLERRDGSEYAEGLLEIAAAPQSVFQRIRGWLGGEDPRRRTVAAAACVRRLYAPARPASGAVVAPSVERLELAGGRIVLGAVANGEGDLDSLAEVVRQTERNEAAPRIAALEVLVTSSAPADVVERVLAFAGTAERITFSTGAETANVRHRTFFRDGDGFRPDESLLDLHPEVAARLDFARFQGFELERHPAPDGIYCFSGRSRELASDERLFVLGDIPGFSSSEGEPVESLLPAFEQTFYEAARSLRELIALRDPDRRLLWNRITLVLSPTVRLGPEIAEPLARRLAPATRHLGLEKVIIRLEAAFPGTAPRPLEAEILDRTGASLQIRFREPHHDPLRPRTDYERKVVEARRRQLVYPYEIVRILTEKGIRPVGAAPTTGDGTFEEYDLDPASERPLARSVAGRPWGENRAAIVFGIVSTPTDKFPEGMRRVLLLSDPTLGMGALAAAECDRIVAAIDLAEKLGLPVEWIPVSAGARIALDSGTENLDATARVVRRIVTFTQAGGAIHILVDGVNVGAQSYFDAFATMLLHTRGILVMTPRGSMVLTGRAALEASGAISAEDEIAIGGLERVMGPNGEAQYSANDLSDAYRILYDHYRYAYVRPGEATPRMFATTDPADRDFTAHPCDAAGFRTVG